MRLPKTIKIFLNYFLGPALFAGLLFSIYQQIKHQPHLPQSWDGIKASFSSVKLLYLVAAVLLIFVNWGLESAKWQLLVKSVRPISFLTAYKAVLSGVSVSVALPNRVGEYLGRMVYQPEGGRLKTISLAIVGGMAQLLVTIFCGLIGLVVLKQPLLQAYPQLTLWFQFVLYGLIFIYGLLALFYFNVSGVVRVLSRWLRSHRFLYLVEDLRNFNAAFLSKILLLSFLRYCVFMLQYIAVFYLFNVQVTKAAIVGVMSVVFVTLAVIPSIALLEVGFRGEVSLRLMGLFSGNSLGIGLTSFTIWLINLVLPALTGTLFLWNIKLVSKKDEEK